MIRWLEWVVKTFGILQRDSVPSQRVDFELVHMSPVSESGFFLKSVQSWFVRCIEWNLCSSWLNPSEGQDQPDKMTNWSQLSWVSCNMSCGSQANNNLNLKLYFQCQWKAMQQKKQLQTSSCWDKNHFLRKSVVGFSDLDKPSCTLPLLQTDVHVFYASVCAVRQCSCMCSCVCSCVCS